MNTVNIRNPKLIIVVLIGLLILSGSCTKSKQVDYEYSDFIFGSYIRFKISAKDTIQGHNAVLKTMQTLNHIDSIASIFNPQSEVSILNKSGKAKMSSDLREIITKALEVSDKSNGAFDITVGPAMKKWGFYDTNQMNLFTTNDTNKTNATNKRKALYKNIRAIRGIRAISGNLFQDSVIGYQKIRIKDDSIFLKTGMAIDLGGIAVGYAVDKAYEILKSDGIKDGLIDAGGEIVVFGDKTYKIGIKNPKGEGIVNTIVLKNQAISTSGNYEKFFEKDDKKYCHIINPKTGQAIADTLNTFCSVTIIADKCVDADAYATAVFVLGLEDGQKLIRKLKLQGILITNDGKMIEVKK